MLRHPALGLSKVGSNAQRKAFFAQQNISAVAGIDGNNGVVLREVADVSLLCVDVALAVQALNPVGAVAKRIPYLLSYTGHNSHIQDNIDGIRELYADFCERRADGAHGIRNDIHRAALVAASCNVIKHFVRFLRILPVVGRACVFLLAGTDKRSVLHTGNIVNRCAVQIAARQFFLIQLNHFTCRTGFRTQCFKLSL